MRSIKLYTVVAYDKRDPSRAMAEQWVDEGNEATNRARRMIAETACANYLRGEWGIEWPHIEFEYQERIHRA